MGVISGISGAISSVSGITMRSWKINEIQRAEPRADSTTQLGMTRQCGIKDWRGYFLGYGHTPVVFPGDTFVFTGSLGGASPKGVTGTAICDRIVIIWDIEAGKVIEYRVDFSANGTLDKSDTTSITDSETPVIECSTSMYVAIAGGVQTDIRYMRLEITAANRPYVSSTTAGQVKRTAGNIDAECTYKLYQDTPANLPVLAVPNALRFYVTVSTYWELTWMLLEEIEDLGANREGAENVGATIKGALVAYNGTGIGTIINPASATKWPV